MRPLQFFLTLVMMVAFAGSGFAVSSGKTVESIDTCNLNLLSLLEVNVKHQEFLKSRLRGSFNNGIHQV